METGLHKISMADYLALPYLSSSLCNIILTQSPRHARYYQESRDRDDTDASDMGTAIHDALLEGIDRIEAIDAQDWRTKAAKEARDAARAQGKIPMLAHKVKSVERAVTEARAFIEGAPLAGIWSKGQPEQTVIWQESGMMCKARPDWLTDDIILHVKTTQGSARPDAWIRNQLVLSGYDVAAMFYERGIENRESLFLVIEQQPPFGCSLIGLANAQREIAEAKVLRAIATWAQCQKSGKYPCYPSDIAYAEPTNWQLAEHEAAMLTAEELSGGIPL